MRWLVSPGVVVEEPDADQVHDLLGQAEAGVLWVHIEEPTQYDVAILRSTFGFHALTIEDLRKRGRGQKIDDYPGYAFIVLQRPVWRLGELAFEEVEVYLSRQYVVTVYTHHDQRLADLRARLAAAPELTQEKPAFLQFLVLDQMIEQTFGVLDELERSINQLERSILIRPNRRQLNAAYDLRQTVTDLDRTLSGTHEIFQHLISHSIDPEDQALVVYYRDLFGHIERQHEAAHSLSELAHSVMEVYMAGADNRLNATMKQLTMLAALFLPVTAISGFFGMNHQFLIEHIGSATAFWATVGVMVATQLTLAVFFWRRGYF